MKRNKKARKPMSDGIKWVITFILFIVAISTVIICAKKGVFHFEAGTVTANDDANAVATTAPDDEDDNSEKDASKFTVFVTAGNGGTANPSGSVTVEAWDSITLNFTPDAGYVVQSVTLDGMDLGAVDTYTISYIDENHNVVVTFDKAPKPTPDPDEDDGIDTKLSNGVVNIIGKIIDGVGD